MAVKCNCLGRGALGLTILCAAGPALADHWEVSKSSVIEGGWQVRGLKRTEGNATGAYDVVVAIAQPGQAWGSNLVAVVYERPSQPSQPWTSKSWSSNDVAAILKQLKTTYPWSDSDDGYWDSGDFKLAVGDPGPVKTFDKGLLSDNFLASIAEAAHSDIVAEIAKNLGWEAADVGFDKWANGDDCTQAATLESYTRSFAVSDATTDSSLAAATMLDYRAGLSDIICSIRDWWCISVTIGPPYPAPGYSTLQCGEIERSETPPYDTTENINIVTHETRTVHHPGETCFTQTCFGVDERKKTVTDTCDGTTITIIERTTNVYLKKCCITGTGIGWGPNHQPPCQLGPATMVPGTHDWLPVP